MKTRIGTQADINGILVLQEQNLYTNLSPAERINGFLTTPLTSEQIQQLVAEDGVFVVESTGIVVGYAFAGSWDFFSQWAIFPYMTSRFPLLQFQGMTISTENSFQYGPVCLDLNLRGSGIFPKLFETMRSCKASRFLIGVTFINRMNKRSLAAHTRKLDLQIIDEFEFNDRPYYSLAFFTSFNKQVSF